MKHVKPSVEKNPASNFYSLGKALLSQDMYLREWWVGAYDLSKIAKDFGGTAVLERGIAVAEEEGVHVPQSARDNLRLFIEARDKSYATR